ncbi:MAG: glycosyltransferase family 2 protein [Thermomicrobiales bacterium]
MKNRLDIVIVNWNTGDRLQACVDSIRDSESSQHLLGDVVIIDNGSTDGSSDQVDTSGLSVRIVRNRTNLGFAAACNQGASKGNSPFILFLNPDVILGPSSLYEAVEYFEGRLTRQVGILGIQLRNENGEVSPTCSRFPGAGTLVAKSLGLSSMLPKVFRPALMTEWDHQESRLVDQVIGAFFMVDRKLFERLDGFDQRFFVYYEELDFAVRARNAGWKSYFLASTYAMHEGGGSSKQVQAARYFYNSRSRVRYARKHFRVGSALIVSLSVLVGEPCSRIIQSLLRRDTNSIKNVAQATLRLWGTFLGMIAAPEVKAPLLTFSLEKGKNA